MYVKCEDIYTNSSLDKTISFVKKEKKDFYQLQLQVEVIQNFEICNIASIRIFPIASHFQFLIDFYKIKPFLQKLLRII